MMFECKYLVSVIADIIVVKQHAIIDDTIQSVGIIQKRSGLLEQSTVRVGDN